jgi:hypothetical protein
MSEGASGTTIVTASFRLILAEHDKLKADGSNWKEFEFIFQNMLDEADQWDSRNKVPTCKLFPLINNVAPWLHYFSLLFYRNSHLFCPTMPLT